MKKLSVTILVTLLCVLPSKRIIASGADAGVSRFTYGVEWGYTASFGINYHYNYISVEGTRLDDKGSRLSYKSNGYISAFAGVNLGRRFNVSVYSGYAGIYEGRRVVPLSVRGSYYFEGYSSDGFNLFADAGCAFAQSFGNQVIAICKAGTGYRLVLSGKTCLDLMMSFQAVADHPVRVIDSYSDSVVGMSNLRRSDVLDIGLNFTVGFSF